MEVEGRWEGMEEGRRRLVSGSHPEAQFVSIVGYDPATAKAVGFGGLSRSAAALRRPKAP